MRFHHAAVFAAMAFAGHVGKADSQQQGHIRRREMVEDGGTTTASSLNRNSHWNDYDDGYPSKPNIIIFMADDLGQDATRLYNPDNSPLVKARRAAGNPFPENAPMPWLEKKLAPNGVCFRNGWAMPVCSPTRVARTTGHYASKTGAGQVILGFTPRFGDPGTPYEGIEFPPSMLDPRPRESERPPRQPDLLQRLVAEAGYMTYKLGKWHEADVNDTALATDTLDLKNATAAALATQGANDVKASGWHEYIGLLSGKLGGINLNGYGGGLVSIEDQPDGAKLDDEKTDAIHLIDSRSDRVVDGVPDARNPTCEFADSALVTRGIQLIKEAKRARKPFFIEYSMLAPHFQYEVPPGPWATEWDATQRGCYAGEIGGWRTLTVKDHSEVIVQIIAAFNDLDENSSPTVQQVRENLEYYGPKLYPVAGTRPPDVPPDDPDLDTPEYRARAEAQRRAAFKGLLSYMDQQMARLTEHVDWENTYIIFLGDNGSQGALGNNVGFDIIEPPNDFSRSKATVYRNGREVPFVFGGKGPVKNVWRPDLVNVIDLYATVLDILGIPQPEDTMHSSFSFADTLKGGRSQRRINVSELWPATATVSGRNRFGSGGNGPFGPGARAVGDDRYSLIAFNRANVTSTGALFVCKDDTTLPEEDCLDANTGIYEHVVDLCFYDVKKDPQEMHPLTYMEMNEYQMEAFHKLCFEINALSRNAQFYQNGKICFPETVSTNCNFTYN